MGFIELFLRFCPNSFRCARGFSNGDIASSLLLPLVIIIIDMQGAERTVYFRRKDKKSYAMRCGDSV